jgi:hypothetical protein
MQTHGTCWLYSLLNGFLMSDGGQKLFYEKMVHFYKGLTPKEKSFFRDGIDAPCPRGREFKPIYFYKFLDQHFCFMGGPRVIQATAGLSPQLLNNANLKQNIGLNTGAHPSEQIVPLLRRLGFDEDEYRVIRNSNDEMNLAAIVAAKPKIIISKYMYVTRPTRIRGYELICSSLILRTTHAAKTFIGHAVAGYVCNGKSYVVDPNNLTPIPCKWWDGNERYKAFKKINKIYDDVFESFTLDYSVYIRRSTLKRIHPACLFTPKRNTRSQVLRYLFPKKTRGPLSPSLLPVPNSKSPVRTRSRGVGKPRKKVPYSRAY